MSDWACTRCGAINLEGQRLCEACGAEPRGTGPRGAAGVSLGSRKAVSAEPAVRPCTDEENRQAAAIMLQVYRGEYSAKEGKRRLAELFRMPELEQEA